MWNDFCVQNYAELFIHIQFFRIEIFAGLCKNSFFRILQNFTFLILPGINRMKTLTIISLHHLLQIFGQVFTQFVVFMQFSSSSNFNNCNNSSATA